MRHAVRSASILSFVGFASALSVSSPLAAQDVDPSQATIPATAAQEHDLDEVDVRAVIRGEGPALTADEVAARAVTTAPSIDGVRAQVRQAEAAATRALQGFFPRLEITGRYTRLSPITQPSLFSGGLDDASIAAARTLIAGVDDPEAQILWTAQLDAQIAQSQISFPVFLDQFSVGATLTVPVSDIFFQVWPAYEAADGFAEATRFQIRARASEVAQQAREGFLAYARTRGSLAVAMSRQQALELQETLVRATVEAGAAAPVELLAIQAQVAGARVAVLRTQGAVEAAAEAVRTLIHEDGAGPVGVAESTLEPPPAVTESRAALLERALARRPETLALRRIARARGRQIDAAEGSRYPHLLVQGTFQFVNPNPRSFPQQDRFADIWDVSVVLNWSPNDFFAGERQADDARAQRDQIETDLRTLEDAIRIQVAQAYEQLSASQAAIEAAQLGVEAAEESLRVRTEQYRAGATTVSELVQATDARVGAQLNMLNATLDARLAYTQLMRAIADDGPYADLDD